MLPCEKQVGKPPIRWFRIAMFNLLATVDLD